MLTEFFPVKFGLKFRWEQGYKDIICETDSSFVVEVVNGGLIHNISVVMHVYKDIMALMELSWRIEFVHVNRDVNGAADYMDKQGVMQNQDFLVWNHPAPRLATLLLNDMPLTRTS
ncbi:hypothetical protein RIF29_28889 [Crotalaria pallida]|uniref:RNase H type-1 domain-containing protein n=1 Tax=Crotalaria pallida TaxID=3830 RepID=A0AAN9EDL7_CROPI